MWRLTIIIFLSVILLAGSTARAGVAFGMADADGQCAETPPISVRNPSVSVPPIQRLDTGRPQVTINFDDVTAPCNFYGTTALRDHYLSYGVTFEGLAEFDGGGILNECGNFGVTGYSAPNFLAFNDTSLFSDGGYAQDPEIIRFDPVVNTVSMNAGSSAGGVLTLIVYNASGTPLDQQNMVLTSILQSIQVSSYAIAFVTVEHTPVSEYHFVIDDLNFDNCTTLTFDDLPDGTTVETSYPGVAFSPGWIVWDSSGSSDYPPHSSPNVIYSACH